MISPAGNPSPLALDLAAPPPTLQAQAQRRERAQRGQRGFHIQINLGRINMRAIMQLLFMAIIMAPVSRAGVWGGFMCISDVCVVMVVVVGGWVGMWVGS